ncbi:hypothetical protein [Nocardioides jishulii]|uniref:Helix-turn-helix domain-containing protein n=1 Tax=Nocardioides jishulii TaxID=2575440 RepID=A0A4U2YS45_9ACTN|nr:hypothetical protein [Nocardioides jishulii]QCX26421.1 hypothetical protein FCL41_01840 [Nocardioides jishulii]TKI63774.1 hypothetical protein FC770_00865 [Nocardioides jishulii]
MTETEGSRLNPLKLVMAINGDTRLTLGERVVLVRAVKHTDNTTRQVHMSQAGIAGAVEVSRDTVKRAYVKALRHGYFSHKQERRNQQGHKVADYWFSEEIPQGAGEGTASGEGEGAKAQSLGAGEGTIYDSSTSLLNSRAMHPDAHRAPCFHEDWESCQDCKPVEACEFHPQFATPCPHCAGRERLDTQSAKHSAAKRRDWHERQNVAEGLNELGEAPEPVATPPGYKSRRS